MRHWNALLWILPTVAWVPPVLCASHPHTFPQHDCLPVHLPEGSDCTTLQMASEHTWKARLPLQDWEKAHKFEYSAPPYGKQTEGSQ